MPKVWTELGGGPPPFIGGAGGSLVVLSPPGPIRDVGVKVQMAVCVTCGAVGPRSSLWKHLVEHWQVVGQWLPE